MRGLPEEKWSSADRACWDNILLPKFSADGLRPLSVAGYFKTFRRWLSHLRSSGLGEYVSPLTRPALDLGPSFLDDVRVRASARTAATEARQLSRLIRTATPDTPTPWLKSAIARFERELKGPPRLAAPPSSDRIFREGCRMIDLGKQLFAAADHSACSVAQGRNLVRDGLMLALLAMRPLRLNNFAELRLGEDLVFCRNRAWIRVAGTDTKTGATFDAPFPQQLFAELEYYLNGPRLAFPNASVLPSLWISDRGTSMTGQVAWRIIRSQTLKAFGAPISAHQFRHAAVTFLAEKHPEQISLAPDILGHANVFIAEQFYNLATASSGASLLQATLVAEATGASKRIKGPRQFRQHPRRPRRRGHKLGC